MDICVVENETMDTQAFIGFICDPCENRLIKQKRGEYVTHFKNDPNESDLTFTNFTFSTKGGL